MRSYAMWFALLSAVVVLVGCAEQPQTATAISPPPTESPTAIPPTPLASSTPDPRPSIIILRLWVPEDLDPYTRERSKGYLLRQLAGFENSYPDLSVEVVVKRVHDRGGMLDFLRTAPDVAPSVIPDLMVIGADDLAGTANEDLIHPLDELLSPSVANDSFPFATAMGRVGGQTMGVVLGVKAQHQAYQASLFDAPRLTWTEVISASSQFVFPAGGRDGMINDATLIQYLAAGGTVSDPDGNPWLDKQPLVQVFTFYSNCIGTGVISPTAVLSLTDTSQAWEQFESGGAGLTLVDAGHYRRVADETTAAAPAPTRYGEPFAIARGWVITMVADDPARQALAMLLLDWLVSPDENAAWTRQEGYLPGTRSAVMFWEAPEGERVILSRLLEATAPAPSPEVMAVVGPSLQRGLEALLEGRATPVRAASIAIESLRQ